MELIQEAAVKSKYDKCKYTVKLWEHNFKKKNGRVPSKLDIREADKDIRNAYRTYFNLKLKALEESFVDVDGFNSEEEPEQASQDTATTEEKIILKNKDLNVSAVLDKTVECETKDEIINTDKTWGTHLNKVKEDSVQKNEDVKSIHSNISQKLFGGSKFSKRNPRKSLSFSHRKSDVNISKPEFLSQPSTFQNEDSVESKSMSEQSAFQSDTELLVSDNLKVVSGVQRVISQPLNVVQNVLESSQKQIRNINSGWLQRVTQSAGGSAINQNVFPASCSTIDTLANTSDYDTDVIYSSDDDSCSILLHASKKQRINSPQKTLYSQAVAGQEPLIKNTDIINTSTCERKLDFSNIFNKSVPENIVTTGTNSCNVVINEDTTGPIERNSSVRKSSRQKRTLVNLQQSSDSDVDPFHSEGDSDDPDFSNTQKDDLFGLNTSKQSPLPVASVKSLKIKKENLKRKTKTKQEKKPEEISETDEYVLEYSVKPRIVSAPRVKNVKTLLKSVPTKVKPSKIPEKHKHDTVDIKDKKHQLTERLEKKITSGTLNENFRTINLKKKVFVKGKRTGTYSKYKKQQWKNKRKALCGPNMDMGGCDGGELICFNCGQSGHFARQCKSTKSDSLLPVTAEENCPFPTLEEASQMARESILAIRKPKIAKSHHDESNQPNSLSENEECDVLDDSNDDNLLAETLKLESAFKLDMQDYIDTTSIVRPIYKLNTQGNVIETPDEVFEALKKFGHTSFRSGQERAIMRILSAKSTLVTLSTGSGKSLCYQLPAYLYSLRQPCITLVISPLVSLMEDQVTGIPSFLKAACLHTNQTKIQREKILDRIATGNLNILLVSPEAVVAGEKAMGFGSLIRKLPPIAFACIDEVHCVSQWSHNFRPSYLMICRVLHDRLGVNTILGLTATATKTTCSSIVEHLKIPDGRDGVIQDVLLPDNLHLGVSKDGERDQALLGLLSSEKFIQCDSIIIYCTRRDECERVASFLRTCLKYQRAMTTEKKKRKRLDVQVEPYHAGMSASRRKAVQTAFMSGELRIVVATVAFGMGINKSNIRSVIHYNLPGNFESYVQEIGRAGRDGLPAYCHLFLDVQGRDLNELRRHIYANSVERHMIRKLLQKIFLPCSCKTKCPRHEVAFSIAETVKALDIPEENISTLLCYLELHQNRYIEVLSPAYITCKVISYGGLNPIKKAAKECPPLAVALVLHKDKLNQSENVIEFPVVDIAAAIGWDSGICKHKLKNLEWTSENNQPKRSLLNVQFSNLGFRLLAPGNLSAVELDEALDSIHNHVTKQEHTALLQLHALHAAVTAAAEKTYKSCLSDDENKCNHLLKPRICEYFESTEPLEYLPEAQDKVINEDQIANDVRALICLYRDNVFSGRTVARIFHGIQSPNYPAVIWGRCKFWRLHIDVNFHVLTQIATAEILKMRY